MSGLYLDAYSGVSGDMMLGALLDLGAPLDGVRDQVAALGVGGWTLDVERTTVQGLAGSRARVVVETDNQPHRRLSDIRALIEPAPLEPPVKAGALAVFELLARAEAKVHRAEVESVHFHEVGALDAIVDIVGSCAALHTLGAERFGVSPLPLGKGRVHAAHGELPVPAPATMEILAACGAPVLLGEGEGEMVTPTGAALVAHFGEFGGAAPLSAERVGYGFGTRTLPWPNALRALLLRDAALGAYDTDEVTLLECNVDDMSPELAPFVVERLLAVGALDAWHAPIAMKKGRPGTIFSALAPRGGEAPVVETLLRETTTLGVRHSPRGRWKAGRREETVQTSHGPVRVKLKLLGSEPVEAAPEYEDCARLATESGLPLRRMYAEAQAAADALLRARDEGHA
jgi:uncharacterized protein (TIGR00299 family) protein